MFANLQSFVLGSAHRLEDELVDRNAVLLLEQKVREADAGFDAAKRGLAAIIVRMRMEMKALDAVKAQIADLEARVREALKAGDENLAREGARVLADLETEGELREGNVRRAEAANLRLRLALEKAERRIVQLRQGLITARSVEQERRAQAKLGGTLSHQAAISEGEALLSRILGQIDAIEEIEVFEGLEAELSGAEIVDRLANAGYGKPTRITADQVLVRLSNETN